MILPSKMKFIQTKISKTQENILIFCI